uniref:Putative cytochrome c-type biogenesis protein n=1 Tax=termite gut metagenome TaxID=433724 RepID=S0DGS8_9ZZZZ
MGWAMMILIGIGAAGLLLAFGARRGMWSTIGAALMIGAIGYAVQGSPMVPGHPVKADAQGIEVDPGIVDLRGAIFGRYGDDAIYLTASDGLQRAGETQAAANLLLGAIHHSGGDPALWTELGAVIQAHDGSYVSPAALLAFRHAAKLAPKNPGPPLFEGLAYVRAGDFAKARPLWAEALALAPPGADYRPQLAVRLDLLDRYLAVMGPANQ